MILNRSCARPFERRPAPPSLKRRLMENRRAQRAPQSLAVPLATAVPLSLSWARCWAALLRMASTDEQQRKGEAARQQVLTALRITNHALDHMNQQLAAHDRTSQQ